jgi:sugar transferase EpsL
VADLQSKMKQMMDDQESRTRMGANARLRAGRSFSKELVTSALLDFYGSIVGVGPRGEVTGQLTVHAVDRDSHRAEGRKRCAMSVDMGVKRIFDLVAGSMLSLACCPVVALLAVALRIILGRPVIFSHERIGLHGKPFQFHKFRTMTSARDERGCLLPDRDRMTSLGERLRRFSLDELPQLWNVLKGDMSLVGPRPLLPAYLPRYNQFQRRRHEVRPGITGWAQVHGRNALTWEQKFELDVWYVDHQSLWLDTKILFLTAVKVLGREGISQQGHATMPEFLGSPDQSA